MARIGDGPFVGRSGSTLSFQTAPGRLDVTVCTPRIVRVRLTVSGLPAGPSYLPPREWAPVACDVRMGEPIVIDTGAVVVRVETRPLRLLFADRAGQPLLRALADDGVTYETDGGEQERAVVGADGRWRVFAAFEPLGEQHLYGLGEGGRQFDRLDGARQLWNTHIGRGPGSDVGVPLLLSHRGYALFFDNTSDAVLAVGRSDGGGRLAYSAANGRLDWYYLAGDGPREVMGEVAELLGRAPLPPRWALGYLQSTRHFEDTAELMALPRTLRERRIPCDGLIFLSTYGEALGWNRGVGRLEFQPALWPDPAALLAELRAQGFHVVTHEYPVLHEDSPLYAEAGRRGYLLDEGYTRVAPENRPPASFQEGQRYLDFSNPEARAWWWAQHRPLVGLGVEGWWLDGGEGPSAAAALHGGAGVTLHNLYDRLRQQAFAEGEAADCPDRRVYLLCRSGGAGMQRDGAACWSGDINNTFATLEAQVPLGLNTGLSGVPYWGTDIGGFFHPVPESGELYARWFQFGAFCPSFRSHGWVWREHVPWAHGPAVEAICRHYAELRYRLLPYTYTLAWQAHTLGLPFMRPLVLNYPDDPNAWELGSEYLWGDDLLVAPVTREGAASWPVYLPAGGWYDVWTQRRYDGPRGVSVEAPLDRLPLFARAGAILPLGPLPQYGGETPSGNSAVGDGAPAAPTPARGATAGGGLPAHGTAVDSGGPALEIPEAAQPAGFWASPTTGRDEIVLLTYPEGRSRFDLYDDDGSGNAYRQGRYALTPIECVADGGTITLRIGAPSGDPSAVPAGRRYLAQVLSSRPRRVTLEGSGELPMLGGADERSRLADGSTSEPGWWHDGEHFTFVRLPASPATITVEL